MKFIIVIIEIKIKYFPFFIHIQKLRLQSTLPRDEIS
jgi:hypothetical protein